MLKPLTSCCLLACASAGTVAHAQTSVYVLGGYTNYGFTHVNLYGEDSSSKGATGAFGGGAFYNFPIQSRVTVGVDARVSYSPGSLGGVLGGAALRVGFVPQQLRWQPFLQVGGGVVHSTYNTVAANGTTRALVIPNSVTSGAGQFVVGLDLRITDHVDLRLPELGAEAGGGAGVQATTAFLNVGLVYHLKGRRP